MNQSVYSVDFTAGIHCRGNGGSPKPIFEDILSARLFYLSSRGLWREQVGKKVEKERRGDASEWKKERKQEQKGGL